MQKNLQFQPLSFFEKTIDKQKVIEIYPLTSFFSSISSIFVYFFTFFHRRFSTDFKNVNIIYSQNENFTLVKQVKQMPGIVYIAQIYIIIFYTMTNFKK